MAIFLLSEQEVQNPAKENAPPDFFSVNGISYIFSTASIPRTSR